MSWQSLSRSHERADRRIGRAVKRWVRLRCTDLSCRHTGRRHLVSCDLTFSARTAAIQEARQTLWPGARRVMDATRFDQFGRWSGVMRHPDGEIQVDEAVCHGTKDRSWGVRNVGEREVGGAPPAPPSVFFLWAPLVWDDHISHAIFFDGPRGEALIREGIIAPLYPREAAVPGVEDGKDQRMATVSSGELYSRHAAGAVRRGRPD